MPTYDYKCTACDHRFEQFQSMKDKPLKKCPSCGKSALERLIGTGAAVLFKGSGFYQTDYRSEGYKKAAAAESKPAGETKADSGSSAAPASNGATKSPEPKAAPAKQDKKKKSE
jgi:putative FmdB family regulatory protein